MPNKTEHGLPTGGEQRGEQKRVYIPTGYTPLFALFDPLFGDR